MKKYLGIELGSTNIKLLLTNEFFDIVASGSYNWKDSLVNSYWSYSLDESIKGIQSAYQELKKEYESKYSEKLRHIDSIGISGMMHGYIVLDKNDKLLTPFRTWRNIYADECAKKLSNIFDYRIPARWSIAHLYASMKNKESYLNDVTYLCTLACYIHYILTGKKAIGMGEASGMFPIDFANKKYSDKAVKQYNEISNKLGYNINILDILPTIVPAGEVAGRLTKEGAKLLDISGDLEEEIPFVAPEGDASTGMVATNAVGVSTSNISAGTSIFGMVVLNKPLSRRYDELDIVATPSGDPVAMVHCNNCSSELNNWVELFKEVIKLETNIDVSNDIYGHLFNKSLESKDDANGILVYPFVSGEHIYNIQKGKPSVLRNEDSKLELASFMRSHIYSALISLNKGYDILINKEGMTIDKIIAHGGLFKTKGVAQKYLASFLNTPITTTSTAGQGGPYGMAVLAGYLDYKDMTLSEYLDKVVFKNVETLIINPEDSLREGISKYIKEFESNLNGIYDIKKNNQKLASLKERVYQANLDLVKNGLVLYTWGNVSAFDPDTGLVIIKPSGVPYETMKVSDMVVVDLHGNIVEGDLNPSSDLPTHLEIYKQHPDVRGIVHTHSTFATAFAQAGKDIKAYGTTHADYFYGDIPCTRSLTKEEIEKDYEINTGKVINETFAKKDILAIPGCVVKNHGVFAFGSSPEKAVYNATVIEEVSKMAYITEALNKDVKPVDTYLLDKHYSRKHGKNAYYGQKKKEN
ncbi:MAG: L-ribulose-5-phosphate 4-epimerase [Bacilli bacterium]|nr:L-ribulose-5-phosphate 4-epimerase [Bacilli bacterium]